MAYNAESGYPDSGFTLPVSTGPQGATDIFTYCVSAAPKQHAAVGVCLENDVTDTNHQEGALNGAVCAPALACNPATRAYYYTLAGQ